MIYSLTYAVVVVVCRTK